MARIINNIFKIARMEAGLTQEDACGDLGIRDTTTLSRYENDVVIPSDEMVSKMVKAYKAKWLGYMYLSEYTNVGKHILPPLILEELGLLVLKFQKEYSDIEAVKKEMIEVACDGKVNDYEVLSWERSMKEVKELASASMSLLFRKEKASQGCSLERAIC